MDEYEALRLGMFFVTGTVVSAFIPVLRNWSTASVLKVALTGGFLFAVASFQLEKWSKKWRRR